MPQPPSVLESAEALLAQYDVIFCDIWGVVHNGARPFTRACHALEQFRTNGGTVVLVSNAPRTPPVVANVLATKGVPETSWDVIISSGGIARTHCAAQGYNAVHHIGPDRDLDVFDGSGLTRVALDAADAIFCTGLINDQTETGEDYRAMLQDPAARGLPLVCANPDLIVDVNGVLLPCAGAIAEVYENLSGPVYWAGKPHATAYEAAHRAAANLRDSPVSKDRILAVGDSVRTDLAGAAAFGVDAIFIAQGIHRDELMAGNNLDAQALARLFDDDAPSAIAAMAELAW